MVEIKKIIDKNIEDKFYLVEQKLRNSFQAIKQDNDSLKHSIDLNNKKIEFMSKEKVFKSDFEKSIQDLILEFNSSLGKVQEKLSELKKEISKKDLQNSIKKEVLTELKKDFSEILKKYKEEFKLLEKDNEKNIENKFRKFQDKSEDSRKDFLMFRHEFTSLRDEVSDWRSNIAKELKSLLEDQKKENEVYFKELKNQINSLKARNTILTRELNSLKGNGSKEILKQVRTAEKKSNKKAGFLNKIVDSLSD